MASAARPLVKIGILSIGDMGAGLARLLGAHGFAVATNCGGRGPDTVARARAAGVELLADDRALVRACGLVLSVVPPRDAHAIARRVLAALDAEDAETPSPPEPLYFADLNAVAPSTVRDIAALFAPRAAAAVAAEAPGPRPREVRFVDGCILGLPPAPKTPAPDAPSSSSSSSPSSVADDDLAAVLEQTWTRPRIPTSGPWGLASIAGHGPRLAAVLASSAVGADVGAASGLKMCFAAVSKGFIALATQSFATARALGVLPALEAELAAVLPHHHAAAVRGVVAMPPKAYRWVAEMREIARTLADDGGFQVGGGGFDAAAELFRLVAEDTVLGQEKIGKRSRGTTVEDVAAAVVEGVAKKRKKEE
ncbi:6-phosphogluconate dehydrogenase C-terminal domain-like protein [Durotheca rogersii]|uniref:6-phosphogluconate dehydrogenase C-terminal domain-like protein n=1 Tax=Durotheca rogersii TaxID=419775 RepID=UPI00221F5721|nr:6-phosphogluconate dehydrogenase C-terminal domain-like protein [Durotheca rogersii]KAI5868308.1 6-phosphogluconate dehydrogenase C-terminal domain-like protein [Durotheca rogersii]